MKTRFGFVSNSSSTSFCIFGKKYSAADVEDADMADIEDMVSSHGLDCMVFDGSYILIGMAVEELLGYETFDQFKGRVAHGLKKFEQDCKGIEAISFKGEWHYGEQSDE